MLNYKVNVYMAKGTRTKSNHSLTAKHLVYTSQFLSHTPVQLLHQLLLNRLMLEQEQNPQLMYTLEVNTVVDQYVIDVRLHAEQEVCATVERGLIELIEREEVRHIPSLEIGKPDYAEFAHLVLQVKQGAVRLDQEKCNRFLMVPAYTGKSFCKKNGLTAASLVTRFNCSSEGRKRVCTACHTINWILYSVNMDS